jgi:hypothetical protein
MNLMKMIFRISFPLPLLQGTLAKRTKQMLQLNFAKEPFRLSRHNDGLRVSVNLIDNLIKNKTASA